MVVNVVLPPTRSVNLEDIEALGVVPSNTFNNPLPSPLKEPLKAPLMLRLFVFQSIKLSASPILK